MHRGCVRRWKLRFCVYGPWLKMENELKGYFDPRIKRREDLLNKRVRKFKENEEK